MMPQIQVELSEPIEVIAKTIAGKIEPVIKAQQEALLKAMRANFSAAMSADPKEPLPAHCRHCGTKLHSEASLARGECAGCFADRKQIGPDRPTGLVLLVVGLGRRARFFDPL